LDYTVSIVVLTFKVA